MAQTLDARGLACPLPVLKAKKLLKSLPVGEELIILATDAGAPEDFVVFCENTGDQLIRSIETEGVFEITIKKA